MSQPGFDTLLSALASGRVYATKLSAPYRISTASDHADAAATAGALIAANPDRVLWGSDWPHPGTAACVLLKADGITPFKEVDNRRRLACAPWNSRHAGTRQETAGADNLARSGWL